MDEGRHAAEAELTDEQLAALSEIGTRRRVDVGEALFRFGEEDYGFFAIVDAEVEIVGGTLEHEIPLVTHGPRLFLGELSLLTDETSRVMARVKRSGEIIAVSRAALREYMARDNGFADLVLAAFIARRQWLREGEGTASVQILGSRYSAQAQALRALLMRSGLPHRWIDLDEEHDVDRLLAGYGVRPADTPVVVTAFGVLRNPTPGELAHALGLTYRPVPGHLFDLVVVGAGPAGLAAGVYGASEGLSTVAVDAVSVGGQAGGSSRIENYLGFPRGISGLDLTERARIQAERFGARISAPCAATALHQAGGFLVVTLLDGSEIPTRAVIIASGAVYRRPDIRGWSELEGQGIYYAATETEAALCAGSPVVILGGGNSAGQAAVFLAGHDCQVHVVIRGANLSNSMSRYLVTRLEADPHIDIITEAELSAVHGEKWLEGVTLKTKASRQTSEIVAGALFCFIGAVPATDWLADLIALDGHGFIRTDRDLTRPDLALHWSTLNRLPLPFETSLPGVFAAGDVRSGSVKRVAAAVGEGSTAVRSVHQYLALAG